MSESDFLLLPKWMCNTKCRKTLAELSATHPKDPSKVEYCLAPESEMGKLMAVDFDHVKELRYEGKLPFLCKSADALYIYSGKWYLIEFKTGKAEVWASVRKIYDSVVLLVESGVLTFDECREKLSFIIVMRDWERFPYYNLGKIVDKDYGEKWDYDVRDIPKEVENADPRILTEQVAKKVLILSVEDFCSFAKDWHN